MIRKHLDTLPVLGCANVSTHSTFSARSPTNRAELSTKPRNQCKAHTHTYAALCPLEASGAKAGCVHSGACRAVPRATRHRRRLCSLPSFV